MQRLDERLLWQETSVLRREGCSKYNECLSIAVIEKMKSFSCAGCNKYDPQIIRVEMSNREAVYPKVEERFNVKEFGEVILASMRKNGVPTKGPGLGNSDWREKESQK